MMWAHLNIQTRPPVAIMLAHLQNITGGAPPAGMCACSHPLVSNRPPPGVRAGTRLGGRCSRALGFLGLGAQSLHEDLRLPEGALEHADARTAADATLSPHRTLLRSVLAAPAARAPAKLRMAAHWIRRRSGLSAGRQHRCPWGAAWSGPTGSISGSARTSRRSSLRCLGASAATRSCSSS
jgi:hypothetical protein